MAAIEQLRGSRVYLDTNIFIYILEGLPVYEAWFSEFFNAIESGGLVCITSELSIAEALVQPLRHGNSTLTKAYLNLFHDDGFVTLAPTTQDIYLKAAVNRAETTMKLPDAIHVATALEYNCDYFLSNDKGIKTPARLSLIAPEASQA